MRDLIGIGVVFITLVLSAGANAGSLHDAAQSGEMAKLADAIAAGEKIDGKNDAGLTPLVLAALNGQAEAFQRLIDAGADPNGRDGNGFLPLHAAAHAGHESIVETLIGLTSNINDQENKAKITPLHAAAERNFQSIVIMLLAHGADIDRKSGTGHTPIFMAILNGHAETVKLLRDNGADCAKIRSKHFRTYCETVGT